jgi:protein TonB
MVHLAVVIGPFSENRPGAPGARAGRSTSIEVVLLAEAQPTPPLQVVPVLRRISVRPPPAEAYGASQASTHPDGLTGRGAVTPTEPSSPPFEQLILEARPQDASGLNDFCTGSYPPSARSLNEQGTVVLLVRIESDGHVSDMKLEESSGSTRLDRVTQACVISGLFEPHRAGLRAVGSWQRIHWTWSPTS